MRPHPLWLLLVEDENGKLQDGDLSADQQRPAADASRCPRVSGWHLCSLDRFARRAGGNGASASGTAKNASRGSSPEARYLRGLTFADHPEANHEQPALLAAVTNPIPAARSVTLRVQSAPGGASLSALKEGKSIAVASGRV